MGIDEGRQFPFAHRVSLKSPKANISDDHHSVGSHGSLAWGGRRPFSILRRRTQSFGGVKRRRT